MHLYLAILLGKLISYLSRLFKIGGGSAAPGLYALKIYPGLLEELIQKIPKNVIITGTNGKTTTARMLAHFAKESGLHVIRNHTGSNLERGIASSLISHFSFPTSHFQLGIWELDEAAFNNVTPKIKPDMVVFLNVFRDQLDRYGEVDSVVKRWCQTLKSLPKETLILVNGDDMNTNKLRGCFTGKVFRFGVKDYKIIGEAIEHKKEKENLDFEATNVKLNGLEGSNFNLTLHNQPFTINLPLPGVYHIYDFLAAFAVGHELGFSTKDMISSLKGFSPAFGRVEKFEWTPLGWRHKLQAFIFLIKNPAGATQVFETIAPYIKPGDRLLFALNDNLADGTDVSWIWDAEFERLQGTGYRGQVVVSGTRAYDLANRLKYAGFDPTQITVATNLNHTLKEAQRGLKGLPAGRQGTLYILPTYTAMVELQRILARMGIKKHYWEEENN